jgi:hypothetical protein
MDLYIHEPNKKTKITLGQREFKGQGGEGSVYVRQGMAYKVYTDPARMIPVPKIHELAALSDPAIIKPEEPLYDSAGVPVGYTMRAVEDGIPLCQTFPRAFRDRHGLTPDRVIPLIERLREGVAHIHSRGVLLVDLNEMNFLVTPDLSSLWFIDVDSYQTPGYPPTALMDSVRDRHNTAFSEGTDWFSFAVVSFQMFIGIHPYRGKHSTLKTMDERMEQNVSALDPSVSLPAVCLPFSVIPTAYRDWYQAVLDKGMRVPPPDGPISSITLSPVSAGPVLATTGRLEIRHLTTFDGPILAAVGDAVLTNEGVYINNRRVYDSPSGGAAHLAVTDSGTVVVAWREGRELRLTDLKRRQTVPCVARADELMSQDGRLYLRQGGSLMEMTFVETPGRVFAQPQPVGSVLEQATQLFPGVGLQNLLGACYASLLPARGVCHQAHLKELDGRRIVDARFDGGVLVVVAEEKGRYDRFTFRFDDRCRTYDVTVTRDIATFGINLTTLPTGICLMLTEGPDGEIVEVFSAKPNNPARLTLTDTDLGGDGMLLRNGTQARFARGQELYEMRLVN